MKRALLAIMLLAAIVFFVFPLPDGDKRQAGDRHTPGAEGNMTAAQELTQNRLVMNQDLQRSDELCRSQCMLHFTHLLSHSNHGGTAAVKKQMALMQKKYRHMEFVEWNGHGRRLTSGKTDAEAYKIAQRHLKSAKQQASLGKSYLSSPFTVKGQTYFVLGVPAKDGSASVTGIVHQDILDQIKLHQVKNLRLKPFPSEGRYKIESADSRTLTDVTVDHPEQNEGTSHYHTNQVVVRFRGDPTDGQLDQIKRDISAVRAKKLGYTYVFESRTMEAKTLMRYFTDKWNPHYVEPHFLYMTNETEELPAAKPNDTLYSRYQWNLPIISTEKGWGVTRGKQEVIVGVVDTGVDLTHPDLQGRLLEGYNVYDKSTNPSDDVGHGTHVAGIIAASVDNNEGVAGMTWFNKILPVKVLDQSGAGSTYSVAEGIIWAADHGAKVINMSLGNYAEAEFLHDAIRYAYDKDIVLIAASGNDNTIRPGYPAAYPEVFAVAATDSNKRKASFSNYGEYVDAAAPGVNIPSTYTGGQYAALSGTSMASPHVAALAGLIRSVNPLLSNTEVMDIMRQSAVDLGEQGKDDYFGYGQIDVANALQAANQKQESLQLLPQNLDRKLNAVIQSFLNARK
ncbi:S8 family peptidase [Paenibacillus gansuensis]|uniref:S8 family peptidase n=1 Tax=Paenibacillus gansuensis TaxID=306542 RepID=A0ABW5PC09_9BACL